MVEDDIMVKENATIEIPETSGIKKSNINGYIAR